MVPLLAFILQDCQPKPQAPNPTPAPQEAVHLGLMTDHGRVFEEISLDSDGSAMQALGGALPVFPW